MIITSKIAEAELADQVQAAGRPAARPSTRADQPGDRPRLGAPPGRRRLDLLRVRRRRGECGRPADRQPVVVVAERAGRVARPPVRSAAARRGCRSRSRRATSTTGFPCPSRRGRPPANRRRGTARWCRTRRWWWPSCPVRSCVPLRGGTRLVERRRGARRSGTSSAVTAVTGGTLGARVASPGVSLRSSRDACRRSRPVQKFATVARGANASSRRGNAAPAAKCMSAAAMHHSGAGGTRTHPSCSADLDRSRAELADQRKRHYEGLL